MTTSYLWPVKALNIPGLPTAINGTGLSARSFMDLSHFGETRRVKKWLGKSIFSDACYQGEGLVGSDGHALDLRITVPDGGS